jgi:hypothetical protein
MVLASLLVEVQASDNHFIGFDVLSFSQGAPNICYEGMMNNGDGSFQISVGRSIFTEVKNNSQRKYISRYTDSDYYYATADYNGGNKTWDASSINLYFVYHKYPWGNLQGFFWGPRLGFSYTSASYNWEYEEETAYFVPIGNGVHQYSYATVENKKYEDTQSLIFAIPGLELGYRWNFPGGVTMLFYSGLGLISGNLKVMGKEYPYNNTAFIYLGSNIGYSF